MKKLLALAIISFFLTNCEDEAGPSKYKYVQNLDFDHGLLNYPSYRDGADAHSGRIFSRADSAVNFGFGYSYTIPDSLVGKNLFIDIDAWVRTGNIANFCELIVSARSGDSLMLWQGCGARETIKAPNEWANIKRLIALPSGMTSKKNFSVVILAHNIDAKSYFDVDDAKLTFFEQGAQ